MVKVFLDKVFEKADLDTDKIIIAEYDQCQFRHVNLNSADLSTCIFIDCLFDECDLSLMKLNNTVFRDVRFVNCKMMGIHFENCNKYGVSFKIDNCLFTPQFFLPHQPEKNRVQESAINRSRFYGVRSYVVCV